MGVAPVQPGVGAAERGVRSLLAALPLDRAAPFARQRHCRVLDAPLDVVAQVCGPAAVSDHLGVPVPQVLVDADAAHVAAARVVHAMSVRVGGFWAWPDGWRTPALLNDAHSSYATRCRATDVALCLEGR